MIAVLLILLVWVVLPAVLLGILVAFSATYDRVLRRRLARYRRLVGQAAADGHRAGEQAAFDGKWVEVSDLPLLTFSANRSSRVGCDVTKTNCERTWASSFLRGHAACTRAKLDAEFDATAAERIADDIARLEAIANGERAG